MDQYNNTVFNMILISLVLIGSINWGLTAFNLNLVEMLSDCADNFFKADIHLDKIIYITVMFAGILLAIRRDTWLPFLGKAVLPEALVPLKTPTNTNKNIMIKTKPNVKIAYWASKPTNDENIPDVVTAYDDFNNSGVVMSDINGNATLPILIGTEYEVPSGRVIPRHVHYRVLGLEYGMIDKVQTAFY